MGDVDIEPTALSSKQAPGDTEASEKLLALLYSELREIARNYMARQPPEHTLQATALVHEAYLKLLGSKRDRWRDRTHFLSLAARAMRCVLIDHARSRDRDKRTPQEGRRAFDEIVLSYEERALDLLALNSALERLAEFDEPMARAVELRFFAGMEPAEIAQFLGLRRSTFEKQWRLTRAWLLREVS